MDQLRVETIEDVKILADLNKLKLTLVTAVTAVAFGMAPDQKSAIHPIILLGVVPLICLFVDCQYYHHLSKIFARASFLRAHSSGTGDTHCCYEEYMKAVRDKISPKLFTFETTAQIGSSILFCTLIPAVGLLTAYYEPKVVLSPDYRIFTTWVLSSSVVVGVGHVIFFHCKHKRSIKKLHAGEEEWIKDKARAGMQSNREAGTA